MTITTTTENITTASVIEMKRLQLRETLSAHLLSSGRDNLLPVFCHIHLRLADGILTAESTDRYRLTVTTLAVDTEGTFDVMLHWNDAQRIVKALPAKARGAVDYVFLTVSDTTLKVDLMDSQMSFVLNTDIGEFPKIGHLGTGDPVATERVGFNPKYLIDFAKMPRERNTALVLDLKGSHKPASSTWDCNGVTYRHVIMAMRLTD
jgi:DNA polymerase III sliding clamp (beta) subunit (PCNA family)